MWLRVSPASVYRVLRAVGLIDQRGVKPSKKGTGSLQPLAPHDHWHIDFSFINIAVTFYYLCSVLDGCSRFVVAWDIRLSMQEADAEIVLQRAREKFPQARPRIISDQGSQFVARDCKEFIRLWQTSHVLNRHLQIFADRDKKLESAPIVQGRSAFWQRWRVPCCLRGCWTIQRLSIRRQRVSTAVCERSGARA